MVELGVNVDHIATLRQARYRGVNSIHPEPDPVKAAVICLETGANSIVMHLREDRRHIQDDDLMRVVKLIGGERLNLEMSIAPGIVKVASTIGPREATLVPEKRLELTTEGGLDVVGSFNRIKRVVNCLKDKGIRVSLFVDPEEEQIDASKKVGADFIELHTGRYSEAKNSKAEDKFLTELKNTAELAKSLGLGINAGHGLNYENVKRIAKIDGIKELNIGHSIISRAVFVGLKQAVSEMVNLIR